MTRTPDTERQAKRRERLKREGKREVLFALSEARIKRVDAVAKALGVTRSEALEAMIDGYDWQ